MRLFDQHLIISAFLLFCASTGYSATPLSIGANVQRKTVTYGTPGSKAQDAANHGNAAKPLAYDIQILLRAEDVRKTQQVNSVVYVLAEVPVKPGARLYGASPMRPSPSRDKVAVKQVLKSETLPMEAFDRKWTSVGSVDFNAPTPGTDALAEPKTGDFAGLMVETYVDGELRATKIVGGQAVQSVVEKYKAAQSGNKGQHDADK
ncbi:MAG: hypothetical protein WCO60_07645 [Verrucomicrobiota bacterium]